MQLVDGFAVVSVINHSDDSIDFERILTHK